MAKKIRRQIEIGGAKRWISGDSEQEYADNLARALTGGAEPRLAERKHNFQAYAQKWFEVFSKPNVAAVTAITYERQLKNHIYPVLGKIDVEDILPADVQRVFNEMDGAKETKIKVKNVLNMVLEQALEDDLIRRNPLHSRSIRITGRASEATEPYTIEQMRFLVGRIGSVERDDDRAFLALHALHPLRPEEVLGLQWRDVDFRRGIIRVERAATHPGRNQPLVKETKTEASRRTIDFVAQAIPYFRRGAPEDFVVGGPKPLTYTQVRRMCQRIQRDTGFEERVAPIRFRTTTLTDMYDQLKDIKQVQSAAGHTTAAMTLKDYGNTAQFGGASGSVFSVLCGMQTPRFTSSKPSEFAFASDEKSIRRPTVSFVRGSLMSKGAETAAFQPTRLRKPMECSEACDRPCDSRRS